MALLNFTVCESNKTVIPWRIKVADPPNLTFSQFFRDLEVVDLKLSLTYVGKAKDRLDLVDSDLVIADVTTLFGPYTKFVSRRKGDQPSTSGNYSFNI